MMAAITRTQDTRVWSKGRILNIQTVNNCGPDSRHMPCQTGYIELLQQNKVWRENAIEWEGAGCSRHTRTRTMHLRAYQKGKARLSGHCSLKLLLFFLQILSLPEELIRDLVLDTLNVCLLFFQFYIMCLPACLPACLCNHMCAVPGRIRSGHQNPKDQHYRQVGEAMQACCEFKVES